MANEELDSLLSSELKEAIDEIILELLKIMPDKKEIGYYENISEDIIDCFLKNNNIVVIENYKKALVTPYALAKYIMLLNEANDLIKEVENDLSNFLDKSKISWVIHKDLSKSITFSKVLPLNSDQKPQNLVIKYSKNSENDQLQYAILSGIWNWNISKDNLKALLESDIISTTKTISTTYNTSDIISQISNNSACIKVNDIEIHIIKKN